MYHYKEEILPHIFELQKYDLEVTIIGCKFLKSAFYF